MLVHFEEKKAIQFYGKILQKIKNNSTLPEMKKIVKFGKQIKMNSENNEKFYCKILLEIFPDQKNGVILVPCMTKGSRFILKKSDSTIRIWTLRTPGLSTTV